MSAVSMTQRIESEKKDTKLGEIKDLVLDGCTATEIEGLSDEYSSLQSLSMVGVGLTSLAGLPALPALTKLNAAENPITGGLDTVAKCTSLVSLNLSGNKLAAIADLAPLASLENLSRLELNNCDLAAMENYRKEVFAAMPHLKFLDGLDVNGLEESAEVVVVAEGTNGSSNGHATEGDKNEEEAEEEDDEESGDDEEEEIGISALQGDKDLIDDDEEDYVPGEEKDNEDDVSDDENEEDEEETGEGDDETEVIANLSGAGVTGPRRAAKRPAEEAEHKEASDAKQSAPDASGDAEESNGVSNDN